jgi:glycine/D-amino acid oxidase-like deaminating enzyme
MPRTPRGAQEGAGSLNERFDVVVVGGGVMGSAVAYHLRTLEPRLSVLVLERDPRYVAASSALSASSIRQQFSTPVNIALSRHGLAFLRAAPELLAVDGERPQLPFEERGYLYLATAAGAPTLRSLNGMQRACGADIALLEPAQLARRFPWLATDDLALGSLGLHGEGWFDGWSLLQALRRKSRALGAQWRTAEVVGLRLRGGGAHGGQDAQGVRGAQDAQDAQGVEGAQAVQGVQVADGTAIDAGVVVNAAGPHAARIARMAGVELPVEPVRHCVFVVESPTPLADCPLVIDPGGLWFRPEGKRFIAGVPPRGPRTPADATLEVDHALFEEHVWPALARRVPAFEALRQVSAWAGHYEMNTFDHNAIIGKVPGVEGLLLINGFSGHGMQQAPAAGRALAELIVHGGWRTLDVSALGFDRIAAGRPLRELNVI